MILVRLRRRLRGRGPRRSAWTPGIGGVVGLVAWREIRERTRSRFFQIGTALIVLVVAAAVVVPVLRRGHRRTERVGVVGTVSGPLQATIVAQGAALGIGVTVVAEPDVPAAEAALRAGSVNLVVVGARQLIVDRAPAASDTSAGAVLVRALAASVSVQGGLETAGIAPDRAAALAHPPPLPVRSLRPARHDQTARATALYGLILLFVLLSQYGTWILMGVVEEKSSRVVEVLLSALRPAQLLTGKVIGIGAVALAQGTLVVGVALGLAEAVGSDLIRGTAPLQVVNILVWLVLGYAFYCWVYAAGGSLAERQEHVQTLAFPLQLPILFGYIVAISSMGSSNPSLLLRVLAYLPPTAPFAMTALVAMGKVTWWQVTLSAALTAAATVVVARAAAAVYGRAILLTGRRVRLREALAAPG